MTDPNIDNNAIDPVMSDLSLDDQAQLFQLLKVEAGMTLTMRKNGAVANGVDVDIAQVTFNNMDEGTKPLVVDYKIEGGTAVFLENKQTTIRKNTNKSLSSTVQLINLTPGKGMIKATPYLNPKMAPAPVEYEFIGKPRKLNLVLTVTTDNQFSDGVAANVVTATLTDENDGNKPVANEKLEFKLSGTAQFKGTNPVTTDAKGKATISLVSNANANISVTVTCTVLSELSVTKNVVVTFKANKLKIVLTVTVDGQYSDGDGINKVTATLTDQNNKRIVGKDLELKLDGNALFTNNTALSIKPTDSNGEFNVGIKSNADTNISVKYTVTLVSNRSVTASVVVNFKAKPKIPKVTDFYLEGLVTNGIGSNQSPCKVRAVVVLDSESPSTTYYVKFTRISTDEITNFYTYFVDSGEPALNLKGMTPDSLSKYFEKNKTIQANRIATSAGISVKGTTDVWIYTGTTLAVWAEVRAELLDVNFKHIAYSRPATNQIVRFAATTTNVAPPPPPPPSVPRWPINVVVRSAEDVYGPTYPLSSNHHRCELYIERRSVPDATFTISIISNGQSFALGDAAGSFGSTISAYAPQTFFLGILRNVTSDLGATIEVRAAQGVVWRGIVYPRSIRLTVIN